jgi:CheY-like chemotaxis protein
MQAQKMEAVGQLAGGIAHDFNNLLTVINGYGEMLERRDLPADVIDDVRAILHAGKSAASLTRQLLAFSRRAMIEPRPTDINHVVRHLNSILPRLIGEDIVLDFALADGMPRVLVDSAQLDQAIINLAVNARDAMPLGGRLTIETGSVVIDDIYVAAHPGSRPGPHAMIAVTDTGVGMDDTVKRRLFEPFFTTKERGHGTGLGLAMVYGTVKQSGGSIWVYSEAGLGTTFKIYLPITGLEERPDIKREPAQTLSGRETILLVEDQDDVRRLARQVLERQGYTVIDIANPRDTFKLDLDPSRHIDLLLTDVVMPHISGRQLARVWQARYPLIRVLYMSGYTADTIVKHGVLEEGLAFIAKPFSGTALLEKVREVLDGPAPPKT